MVNYAVEWVMAEKTRCAKFPLGSNTICVCVKSLCSITSAANKYFNPKGIQVWQEIIFKMSCMYLVTEQVVQEHLGHVSCSKLHRNCLPLSK